MFIGALDSIARTSLSKNCGLLNAAAAASSIVMPSDVFQSWGAASAGMLRTCWGGACWNGSELEGTWAVGCWVKLEPAIDDSGKPEASGGSCNPRGSTPAAAIACHILSNVWGELELVEACMWDAVNGSNEKLELREEL